MALIATAAAVTVAAAAAAGSATAVAGGRSSGDVGLAAAAPRPFDDVVEEKLARLKKEVERLLSFHDVARSVAEPMSAHLSAHLFPFLDSGLIVGLSLSADFVCKSCVLFPRFPK